MDQINKYMKNAPAIQQSKSRLLICIRSNCKFDKYLFQSDHTILHQLQSIFLVFVLDVFFFILVELFYIKPKVVARDMSKYIQQDVMVVIVWQLDLQLPVQSVPITIKDVNSNPAHGDVYSLQHYVVKFVSDLWKVGGFLRILQFPPPIKLTYC